LALVAPVLAACEPGDDAAPPVTAQNTMTAPPDVPPPGPPIAPSNEPPAAPGAPATADARYASGEYALGDDATGPTGSPTAVTTATASANADAYEDNDPSSLSDFRTTLDPYGTWVDDSTYGTVWVPATTTVGADFAPYSTAGHWAYDDDDWVWVSDYSWGWAPFHYGRWVWIDGRGWSWIPGRVYRGAWVEWGVNDGYSYVGWYPAPPAFLWFGGVAVGYSFYVGPRWVYCPRGEVFSPVVGQRVVTGAAAGPIAQGVRPVAVARPGVAGAPSPQRLGYTAAQIPHARGSAATGVARAQQFGRPSTAQSLGARPPSHVAAASAPAGRTPYVAPHAAPQAYGRVPATGVAPVVTPGGGRKPAPAPAAPARGVRGGGFRGGGGFHLGGGHHR
jgi:hypothetical protein